MALVKASLKLFGGDTVVVRCSERCHIHLMSEKNHVKDTQSDILSVQDRDNAWLTVPYTGVWNVLMIWLLDWLIPWAGGDYKLWLRSKSGRLLAWQGNGEANFRHNLAVLEDATGLPVVVAEEALSCVALGTGRALEEIKRLRHVLTSMY